MPGYNLDNITELIKFDQDCVNAANEAPQEDISPITDWVDATYSTASVFSKWYKNHTLWSLGYHKFLTTKAKETFKRYSRFRDGRITDSESGTVFDPKDTFKIGTSYTKSNTCSNE